MRSIFHPKDKNDTYQSNEQSSLSLLVDNLAGRQFSITSEKNRQKMANTAFIRARRKESTSEYHKVALPGPLAHRTMSFTVKVYSLSTEAQIHRLHSQEKKLPTSGRAGKVHLLGRRSGSNQPRVQSTAQNDHF